MNARPKSLYGAKTAIACGHHLATQTAKECLDAGGSLADAMIAASAVLSVALPHATSMGGCGMVLYLDGATGQVHGLNGTGRAPLRATPEEFTAGMPQRGVRAAVTPTLVRLWARLHERFGRQDWASLLAPAIRMAAQGVAAPEELVRNLAKLPAAHIEQPGFAAMFKPAGRPLAAGDRMLQPHLAQVLRDIAEHGEAGFYQGRAAASLADFSRRHGGLLSLDDFDVAQADWVTPWSCRIGGTDIYAMPPNSVGALMLRQLEVWHAAGRAGGAEGMAADIENAMAIIAQGHDLIGDPARTPLQPARFGLNGNAPQTPGHAALNAARLAKGDTAGFVAMDDEGNAVAMLQSVFQPFGSCAVDPGTGILLNNRMFDFSPEPGRANSVGPGMRPSHTLNPWLMLDSDGAYMAGVSPGGVSQTTTGFQVASRALGGADTLGQLVSYPRWSLSRTGEALLEPGIAPEVAQLLRAHGHRVIENSDHEFYFGSAKLIRRLPQGWLEAAADARRQATALAW